MARSLSATYLAAQQAATNTPYCKLLFTSKSGGTTVDLSTDSSAYSNRILLIDHTEESYDDFATIILRNVERDIPSVKGYWIEIGYGYTTGAGNEYLGDGTNEPAPPRLWVKHQQTISAGGKLWEVLELEGMWAKLRETLIRLGNPPLYTKGYTTDTIFTILGLIIAECKGSGVAMALNALVEDDGIIDTLQPQFDINAQPFEYAAPLLYRLLYMTASYLKALDDLEFEIKYPQSSDAVDLTFYSDQVPYFHEYLERENTLIPNHFLVYGNAGSDRLWSNYLVSASPNGVDQAEIDAYDDIYKIILAGSLTTQTNVNSRAASMLARAKFEAMAGRMYAPHEARLEMYDRIEIRDRRGFS
ncbi:hypothetical protein LCGC14_0408540 [marine sediment metagenome]|uniref:Uncharacterized protein n=1 Tax=marine sediment metagenome TaxID=412755 RepID=A0A0F9TCF0_9ZZZZ